MTMTLRRFQRLLDVHGADLARWPQPQRQEAERLLASDHAAAAAFAQARALDALIAREAQAQPAAAGLLRALEARPLPRQRRRFLWRRWPSELLNFDFALAWPRLAALGGVAVLGFAIGLTDVAGPILTGPNGEETGALLADNDIGAVVFAPDPLPEVRP
jgi:ferric-dicitrate binding protein FerR (iron transport regulator)